MSSPTQSPLLAWRGVETGTPDARECAVLAREANSALAIRTLIYTDHLDEAHARLARMGAGSARLRAELALRAGLLGDAQREAMFGGAEHVLAAALIARGAYDDARAIHASAEWYPATGDFERAATLARADGRRRTAAGQTNPARSAWRATLAAALARSGAHDEAIDVAEDGLARARAFGAPTALATSLLARAIAEPDLEARAEYAAAALEVPTPAALVLASARIELGAALLQLGCDDEGREALRRALEAALAAGARPLAARAGRTLALAELQVVV